MTQWAQWQTLESAAGRWGQTLPAFVRGYTITQTLRFAPELAADWGAATVIGEVRASPDASAVLATWTITGPVLLDGKQVYTATLSAATTNTLPDQSLVQFRFSKDGTQAAAQVVLSAALVINGRIVENAA